MTLRIKMSNKLLLVMMNILALSARKEWMMLRRPLRMTLLTNRFN